MALELIRSRFAAGQPLTIKLIFQAHDEAYDLKGNRKRISQYTTSNLRRPLFANAIIDHRLAARVLKLGVPRDTVAAALWPEQAIRGEF